MKIIALILAFLFSFTSIVFAQQKFSNHFQPKFTAIFKDVSGAVVPGLKLVFKKGITEDVGLTDINGEIDLHLFPGDYAMTIENVDADLFRAFLRVGGDALIPNSPQFLVDTARIFPDTGRPAILKAFDPKYPPAAMAVRVYGEIKVTVKIDKEGKVVSATALTGNPLMRAAAVVAARQFIFGSSEKDPERTIELSFVFLPLTRKNPDIKRYQDPYRIIVHVEPEPPDFSSSK